ncbi:MAG: ribosome assembly cofactor RimP [Flavobacterium sp.]
MDLKEVVQLNILDFLNTRNDLFLIDLEIDKDLKIEVVIDGDEGVILQDCIDLAKYLNEKLEDRPEDFSLDVFSAGVSLPLKDKRQYPINIGRILQIKTFEKEYLAELKDANLENITISWKSREPKKIGKGKETITHTLELRYEEIKEAIVTITF